MTRLYLFAGIAVAALAVLATLWWLLDRNASLRAENEGLRGDIQTSERISDAINDSLSTGDDWFERLRRANGLD